MSLLLVVARPARSTPGEPLPVTGDADQAAATATARADVWQAVRHEVEELRGARSIAAAGVSPGALDGLARAIADDPDDPSVRYAASPDEAVADAENAIAAGARAIAVVPVALALDEDGDGLGDRLGDGLDDRLGEGLGDAGLGDLHERLDELARRHPGVDVQYVGPPYHAVPALESAIAALRPVDSEEPQLLAAAIQRAFDGDLDRFGRFMTALQAGVPPGTRLVLRGSAVQGESYRTGEPFDARGPRTSDLDVVLIGEEAMASWEPEAFYIPGVNTQPLYDDAPDLADPRLERARREAQEAAGRPVSLQAMARWFLDLRSGLQGTPYVVLGG
jgi:hypothetical protein